MTRRNEKFISSPVGINTVGEVPKAVAKSLNLLEIKRYTSHCMRRTSATVYADSGASEAELMRLGKWKSRAVAAGYLEDSVANKTKVRYQIVNSVMPSSKIPSEPVLVNNSTAPVLRNRLFTSVIPALPSSCNLPALNSTNIEADVSDNTNFVCRGTHDALNPATNKTSNLVGLNQSNTAATL